MKAPKSGGKPDYLKRYRHVMGNLTFSDEEVREIVDGVVCAWEAEEAAAEDPVVPHAEKRPHHEPE